MHRASAEVEREKKEADVVTSKTRQRKEEGRPKKQKTKKSKDTLSLSLSIKDLWVDVGFFSLSCLFVVFFFRRELFAPLPSFTSVCYGGLRVFY